MFKVYDQIIYVDAIVLSETKMKESGNKLKGILTFLQWNTKRRMSKDKSIRSSK